jgi:hypothetical protein
MAFLTTAPLPVAALILLGGGTSLAMLGAFLVRSRVALDRLRANNEVAGFKFATLGVLYGVLLAFAVLVVWGELNDAQENVATEAGAAATMFRLAEGLAAEGAQDGVGDAGAPLRAALAVYLGSAIEDDWPAMERGEESVGTGASLDGVYAALLAVRVADPRDAVLLAEALRQADVLTQARRARIVVADGVVPGVVWCVLFLGAFVTIAFTFFFGTASLRAQVLMTGALSLLIFSCLLIIVAIDRPFAGMVRLDPRPLTALLEDFGVDATRP